MHRASIGAGLIIALAGAEAPSLLALPEGPRGGSSHGGGLARVQACRVAATTATTRSKGAGFTAEIATTCQHDKATNQSTCANKYTDSVGTSTSTVSVTTFASLADAIDEVKVIPPRRRSLRTDTTAKTTSGSSASSLVNTYDREGRLDTSWDEAGRPTAGKTITRNSINSLSLAYDAASRTVTTTTESGGQRLVCTLTFDANGNPAATSCKAPGGMTNSSITTTTATEKICR